MRTPARPHFLSAPPRDLVFEAALALYLLSAFYKAATVGWGFDVTLVFGGLAAVGAARRVMKTGRVPVGIRWPLGYFLAAAPVLVFLGHQLSGYGMAKAIQFYTISLLGALVTPILIHDYAALRRFLFLTFVPALFILVLGVREFSATAIQRLDIASVSSVSLGRGLGATALIAIAYTMVEGGRRGLVALGFGLACALTILFVGNRQGLLGLTLAVAAMQVVMLINGRIRPAFLLRGAAILSVLGAAFYLVLPLLPRYAALRFEVLLSGGLEASAESRFRALGVALSEGLAHPFGSGWGAFHDLQILHAGGQPLAYPHNVFLETFHELGIVQVVLLLAWVAVALRSAYLHIRRHYSFETVTLFGLLLFNVVVSSVSGEASSEKMLWALLALSAALPHTAPRRATMPSWAPHRYLAHPAL